MMCLHLNLRLNSDWIKMLFVCWSLTCFFLFFDLFPQRIHDSKDVNVENGTDQGVQRKSYQKSKDGKYREKRQNIFRW